MARLNPRPRRMRLDHADIVFSQCIRLRDRKCVRCHSPVELNFQGLPKSHQNSHYFGRTREGTRYEPDNCDTLCHGCHRFWEKEDREAYRHFKVKQLGQKRFDSLHLQSNTYFKKDRAMRYLEAKMWLDELVAKTKELM